MNMKNFFGSRKFKYGSVAIVFSIAFVALVLVFNAMLTVIGQRFSLYADLTSQEFYTVSESSREQLKSITEPVEIVFFKKKEDIADPSGQADALGYVKYLAEEYKKSFDFVDVKYVDMLNSPAEAHSYKATSGDTIRTDSVVINCPSTGKKKIIQVKGFFSFDSNGNVYGFNGEKRITSSILQVANTNKPRALFTTGHNEYVYSPIVTLLDEQGYELGLIDLSTQDIPGGTDVVIINQPSKDFAGISSGAENRVNEIEKIKNFIQKDYGDVILVLPAVRADGTGTTPDLPELRELLEENFGITYVPGAIVADSTSSTIDKEGIMLVSKPAGTPETYEYQIHKSVTEKGIKIIAPYSVPLQIIGGTDKYTVPVLVSSENSYVSFAQDSAKALSAPSVPLVALSSKIGYDENQNEIRGNLLVAGSLLFEMTDNSAYGNQEFFYGVLKTFGNTSVSVDIPAKPFNDTYLDITRKDANAMTILVTAMLPVIMLICGIAVWTVRKRK